MTKINGHKIERAHKDHHGWHLVEWITLIGLVVITLGWTVFLVVVAAKATGQDVPPPGALDGIPVACYDLDGTEIPCLERGDVVCTPEFMEACEAVDPDDHPGEVVLIPPLVIDASEAEATPYQPTYTG